MTGAPPHPGKPSQLAATVIIFRNGPSGKPPEILMTIRSKAMDFAGGMAVFPGGRVDDTDFALARTVAKLVDLEIDEAAHRIGAIRETLEETGLAIGLAGQIDPRKAQNARIRLLATGALAPVLDEFGWSLDLAQLTPFARWHPKLERVRRVYDTRFYLADLGTGDVDIAADLTENTHLFWVSAQDALDAADQGKLQVIYPTRRNLERLAQFASFAETRAHAEAIPVRTISPYIDDSGTLPMLRIPDDAGYPITSEPLKTAIRG